MSNFHWLWVAMFFRKRHISEIHLKPSIDFGKGKNSWTEVLRVVSQIFVLRILGGEYRVALNEKTEQRQSLTLNLKPASAWALLSPEMLTPFH